MKAKGFFFSTVGVIGTVFASKAISFRRSAEGSLSVNFLFLIIKEEVGGMLSLFSPLSNISGITTSSAVVVSMSRDDADVWCRWCNWSKTNSTLLISSDVYGPKFRSVNEENVCGPWIYKCFTTREICESTVRSLSQP